MNWKTTLILGVALLLAASTIHPAIAQQAQVEYYRFTGYGLYEDKILNDGTIEFQGATAGLFLTSNPYIGLIVKLRNVQSPFTVRYVWTMPNGTVYQDSTYGSDENTVYDTVYAEDWIYVGTDYPTGVWPVKVYLNGEMIIDSFIILFKSEQVGKMLTETEKLIDENSRLKGDLQESQQQIQSLQEQLTQSQNEIRDLNNQLIEANQEISRLDNEKKELAQENENLKSENQKLQDRVDNLEKQNSDLNQQNQALQTEISNLNNQISNEKEKSSQLEIQRLILIATTIIFLATTIIAITRKPKTPPPPQ